MQVANAREAESGEADSAARVGRRTEAHPYGGHPIGDYAGLDEAGVLELFAPALPGAKLNLPGLEKFEKLAICCPTKPRIAPAAWGRSSGYSPRNSVPRKSRRCSRPWSFRRAEVGRVQKLERALEETGNGAAVGADSQAFAGLSHCERGGARRDSADALPVDIEAGAGAPTELFQKYLPADAGDHPRGMGDRGREARDAEISRNCATNS